MLVFFVIQPIIVDLDNVIQSLQYLKQSHCPLWLLGSRQQKNLSDSVPFHLGTVILCGLPVPVR